MTTQLYFAFGSNLDHEQMARRCPGALPHAPAVLPDHKIAFCGYSYGRSGGTASVLKAGGASVPGLLWLVSGEHIKSLDRYEGAPVVYKRERVLVEMQDGATALAWTYVMVDNTEARPSDEYFGLIYGGYNKIYGVVTADHIGHLHDARENAPMFKPAPRRPVHRPKSRHPSWASSWTQRDFDEEEFVRMMSAGSEVTKTVASDEPIATVYDYMVDSPFMFADEVVRALARAGREEEADDFQYEVISRDIGDDLEAIIDLARDHLTVEEELDFYYGAAL